MKWLGEPRHFICGVGIEPKTGLPLQLDSPCINEGHTADHCHLRYFCVRIKGRRRTTLMGEFGIIQKSPVMHLFMNMFFFFFFFFFFFQSLVFTTLICLYSVSCHRTSSKGMENILLALC